MSPWSPIGLSKDDTVWEKTNHNIVNEPRIARPRNLLGTSEFGGVIRSTSQKPFSVKIRWTDSLGNLVLTQEPSALQNIGGTDDYEAIIEAITVKSDRCEVRVIDESGDAANEIMSTINFH